MGGEIVHTAAEGNGPVSALDAALRKALAPVYPEALGIHLADYKVRILDGIAGTSATVRVLIDSALGDARWTTVGASSNMLEASWTRSPTASSTGWASRGVPGGGRRREQREMRAKIVLLRATGSVRRWCAKGGACSRPSRRSSATSCRSRST